MKKLWLILTTLCIFFPVKAEAVPIEYTDEATFKTATGNPQHVIDFETYGDGTPVVGTSSIDGDEWLNFGIQFAAIETGDSLTLFDSANDNYSPTHALIAGDQTDVTSYLITFSTPVSSFGLYIVDNEYSSSTEKIILKDDNGNILQDFAMPVGGAGEAFFRGYLSDTPIAEVQIIEDYDGEGLLLDDVMYVPEPTTLLLLGLGGIFLRRRS